MAKLICIYELLNEAREDYLASTYGSKLSARAFSDLHKRISVDEISKNTGLDPFKVYPSNFPAVYPISSAGSLGSTTTVDIRRIGVEHINKK